MTSFFTKLLNYPLTYTLLVAGLLGMIWLFMLQKRLRMHWLFSVAASVVLVIYCVYAVRFFALLEAGFDRTRAGSMSLYGVPFFVPVLLLLGAAVFRRPLTEVFDVFAINTVLICLGGRANCFFCGCCLGSIIPGTAYRAPTREIEVLFYILFIAVTAPRVFIGKTKGTAFPAYMIGYGALRFLLEFFRETSFSTTFHLAHFWSLLCAAIGASIVLALSEREKKKRKEKKKARH